MTEYEVELPQHGRTTVIDIAGPPGAPTVMLLHGLGATARLNWAATFRPLSQHFRVLGVDHRGHGRGLKTRRFRLEQCAADAAAVARARGVERVIAVGYSMGGPIASLLWHRHRELVDGLVLCATAHQFVPRRTAQAARLVLPAAAGIASLMPGQTRDYMLQSVLRGIEHPEVRQYLEQEVSQHVPASLIQAVQELSTFSSEPWIRGVDVPSAVLVMRHDGLVPPDLQRKLASLIPDARVFEIDGDHLACSRRADLFVPTLIRACHDVGARAASRPRSAAS